MSDDRIPDPTGQEPPKLTTSGVWCSTCGHAPGCPQCRHLRGMAWLARCDLCAGIERAAIAEQARRRGGSPKWGNSPFNDAAHAEESLRAALAAGASTRGEILNWLAVSLTTQRISVRATPDWGEHFTYQFNGLTPEEAASFLTLWSESWRQIKAGRPLNVTAENAKDHAARIRKAFRTYVDHHNGAEPSQQALVDEYSEAIGYTSKRGLEQHLKDLRPFTYRWPESFR